MEMKKSICTGGALIASLALAGGVRGQCPNACGPGTLAEAEACVSTPAGAINDGCNLVTPAFQAVGGPATVCGHGSTYVDGATDTRDTDWMLISPAALAAADLDDNGIVQVQAALESEFLGVVFIITVGNPICTPAAVIVGQTGFSPGACNAGDVAKATITLADNPNGVVVFVSTGNADGTGIFTGFACAGGLNDYTAVITLPDSPTECAPGSGPCDVPHATPGCEDPECCKLICDVDDFCCSTEWDIECVNLGVNLGCICLPIAGAEGVPAPSSDDFDSYVNGQLLDGVNGWGGWDGSAAALARISNLQSHSAPNSVRIDLTDDQVQQYLVFCEGQYTYTIWQYVPSEMTGLSYFILLNSYSDPGFPGGAENWSSQVSFSTATGLVNSEFENDTLSLITDEWVEIRLEIDLDADTQTFFYGGDELYTKSWTDGVSTAGLTSIRAVDLFGNGATAVYYDDVSLVAAANCPWDCQAVPNGSVGINDLLDLLAQWGGAGACNFDGGVVGITDLLKLLANWGPCP